MSKRDHIPNPLRRQVLVEAGHRCAIPTCRQVPIEIAHIVPYSRVNEHTFDNLIALCPNCHTRFDNGDIDRKSMRAYKANLTILSVRYGDLERRVLELFADHTNQDEIMLPGSLEILLRYLLQDGLLARGRTNMTVSSGGVTISPVKYRLTPRGRDFVSRWVSAREID